MGVPFVDLKIQNQSIKEEVSHAIGRVLDNATYILGDDVDAFEKEFSHFCSAEFGIGVSSGTAALHLALLATGVGSGDEVITVPNTFIATAEAISMVGAKPIFVDIDEKTYNIDVERVEKAISFRTKAIIPVHLFGQSVDMEPLLEVASRHGLKVIEDACQAHGAAYRGKRVGSFGDAGCFSFYPSKNLGTFGEAGMVVTNDEVVAKKVRILRDHGQSSKNVHQLRGYNYRMEGIHGAVLRVKLKRLPEWIEMRCKKAHLYNELLRDTELVTPFEPDWAKHVYHLYVIRVKDRSGLFRYLESKDIGVGIHYLIPIHLQEAYQDLGYKKGSFPIVEKISKEILSLPIYPELTEGQIREVVHRIKDFVS